MKTNRNDFLIPGEAVEACGFDTASPLCFHAGPDALIVVPRDMTAMQIVNAIDALTELSTTLICAIIQTPFAHRLFQASLYGTFVIPVILYAFMIAIKMSGKDKKEDNENNSAADETVNE